MQSERRKNNDILFHFRKDDLPMTKLSQLKIDPEFQNQINPPSFEETHQLEMNILKEERVLNPIITWNGYIVDGYTRYQILRKYPFIPFEVIEKEFSSRYEALAWICKNQLGRRNLTPEQKKFLIGKQAEAEKQIKSFHGNQYTLASESGLVQNEPDRTKHGSRSKVAAEHGTSESYVYRAEQFAKGRRKPIKTIEKILEQSVSSIPENAEDYYGMDGLLYCGKCHTPREAFFAKGVALMGKNKHPIECSCQRIERAKQEALISQQKHSDLVRRLKAEGFSDPAMLDWKFENDNGRSPQMCHAHRYVEQWQTMRAENLGLFLWGGVGTGKSFLAGCIANALMEQEVPVRMTNFARILNELNSSFSGRNDIVDRLCRYPLLIIDDFGMERGTEYALEQIYNIVDSRYRSRKPLIVTTNLTLDEIRHPQDTAHARIYDRLLEMCVPISCIGVSFRKETAQEKLERLKLLIG